MRRLKSFLTTRKDAKVLDVGSGNGNFISLLSGLYEGTGKMIGIDNLQIAVDTANKNFDGNDRIEFIKMDALNMDFKDGEFGIVTLSNSLHHLDDPQGIFNEMERVLEKYGIIIINEMISDGLSKRQKSHLLIHHFAAEIDREIGNTHHETYKGVEIVEKVKGYSSLQIKMVFEVNNKREINNNAEEIEWLYKTMEKLLVKVEKSDKYSYFKKRAEKVKKHIHKYGFDSATQLVIVLG